MNCGSFRNYFRVLYQNMTSTVNTPLSPVGVRGIKVLDRDKFLRNIQIPVLKVTEDSLAKITSVCKSYFLKLDNLKPVQNLEDPSYKKCIYLNPEKISKWSDILEKDRKALSDCGVNESNFGLQNLQLSYENWKYDAIFKAVLPENEEIVSGFSQIGHIIHLNLRDHLLDYRPLIGEVLLDKIKTCKTVINKSNIIDNTYRNFSMEVIAGEENFLVTVKENNCNFHFDFSKVYWNPRLGKEHERILSFLKPGDVLFDVFCGVGPFSVPATKKKCKVFANDLNPESFKWLNHNAKINKLNMSLFKSYNLDGADFICSVFKDYIINLCKGTEELRKDSKLHITMNLPAMAVEFLKYFNGLIKHEALLRDFKVDVIVYVYCFAVGDNPVETAKKMVIDHLRCDISSNIVDVFGVRNVSPKKEMMRVTFKLTKDVICGSKSDLNCEPPVKKLCVQNNLNK